MAPAPARNPFFIISFPWNPTLGVDGYPGSSNTSRTTSPRTFCATAGYCSSIVFRSWNASVGESAVTETVRRFVSGTIDTRTVPPNESCPSCSATSFFSTSLSSTV